jgi:hypothetical protein
MRHPSALFRCATRRIAAEPLFRLLIVNLGIGILVSVILVAGLLSLNLHGLRNLILADQASGTAFVLLLFGFLITFGSAAMGTAIMAIGTRHTPPSGAKRMPAEPLPAPVNQTAIAQPGETPDRLS